MGSPQGPDLSLLSTCALPRGLKLLVPLSFRNHKTLSSKTLSSKSIPPCAPKRMHQLSLSSLGLLFLRLSELHFLSLKSLAENGMCKNTSASAGATHGPSMLGLYWDPMLGPCSMNRAESFFNGPVTAQIADDLGNSHLAPLVDLYQFVGQI